MATINLATIYMLYVCHLIANNWFAIPKSRNPCKTLTTRIPEEGILHHAVPDCFHLWSSRCSNVDWCCCVNIHKTRMLCPTIHITGSIQPTIKHSHP